MTWVEWLLCAATAAIVGAVGFGIYGEIVAEKFYLRKDQWHCTAPEQRSTTTFIQSGNSMIPITAFETHCLQWTENK